MTTETNQDHSICWKSDVTVLFLCVDPAVHIYAGVAASLAERKKGHQLTELLRNIKGTIEDDDWDQVGSPFKFGSISLHKKLVEDSRIFTEVFGWNSLAH